MFLALALSMSACTRTLDNRGLAPALSSTELEQSTRNYLAVRDALIRRAGLDQNQLSTSPQLWFEVAAAGIGFVDEQCNGFFDDLFAAERNLRTLRQELGDISSAASVILAAAGAQKAISFVATALGLASHTVDNVSILRLVNLGPDKVRRIVSRSQEAYKYNIARTRNIYVTQSAAMEAVAGYLKLCRVPTISSHIDEVFASIDFKSLTSGDTAAPALRMISTPNP
jgi:23S rRNA maturation mini-RNase III